LNAPRIGVSANTTIVNTELQTADRYVLLNSEYSGDAPFSSGFVFNIDPNPTSYTIVGISSNVVSLGGTDDPTGTLGAGDFILIQSPTNPGNAGIFEVDSVSSIMNTVTIKTMPTEPFSGVSLIDDGTDPSDGVLVGVSVAVLRSSTTGVIETAFGGSGPLSYSDLITTATLPAAASLAATLVVGNSTGGNDLLVTSGDQIDAASAVPLVLGSTTASSVALGSATIPVTAAGWMNVGTTTSATAQGDFSAGLTGGGNSRLIFDHSAKTLSIIPNTDADDCIFQLGSTTGDFRGSLTMTADGTQNVTFQGQNRNGSGTGTHLNLYAGDANNAGGSINMRAGTGGSNLGSPGGSIVLDGGLSTQFAANNISGGRLVIGGGFQIGGYSGNITLTAGGAALGDVNNVRGGDIYLNGGETSSGSLRAGNIRLLGGKATDNTGVAGDVTIRGGEASHATGTRGNVFIDGGLGIGATLGSVNIGITYAGAINIARSGITTTFAPGSTADFTGVTLIGIDTSTPTLAEVLAAGNTSSGGTSSNDIVFSDDDNLLWATDGGGNIGSGPTSLDNRPGSVWVKDLLQVGDSTVTISSIGDISASRALNIGTGVTPSTTNGDIRAGDGTSELVWANGSGGALAVTASGNVRAFQVNTNRDANNILGHTNSSTGTAAQASWQADCNGRIIAISAVNGGGGYAALGATGTATFLRIFSTGNINFRANGTANRWVIDGTNANTDGTSGHLLTGADNTYDIGASGATRPRTAYIGTSVVVGDTITITTNSVDASGALTVGGAAATSLTLGRSAVGVSMPSWLNLGTTTSAVAAGDLAAGQTGAGNSQLLFDQSAKTLSITPGTDADDCILRLGTASSPGSVTLTADGSSTFIIQANNGVSSNGTGINIFGGESSQSLTGGPIDIRGGEGNVFGGTDSTGARLLLGGGVGSGGSAGGGDVTLTSGSGFGTGFDAGDVTITCGAANSANPGAGIITIRAGAIGGSQVAGTTSIFGGNATAAGGTQGGVNIDAGTGAGTTLGSITIGTANAGDITIGRSGETVTIGGNLSLSEGVVIGSGTAGSGTLTVEEEFGASTTIQHVEIEVTGMSGASVTASSLIPAGVLVLGVSTRVTTAVTGASDFDIGDGVDVDRWGAGVAIGAGSTTDGTDFTDNTVSWTTASAGDVVLTANGSNFLTGAVRIVVTYMSLTAPTS
jgi:hypothetical protein